MFVLQLWSLILFDLWLTKNCKVVLYVTEPLSPRRFVNWLFTLGYITYIYILHDVGMRDVRWALQWCANNAMSPTHVCGRDSLSAEAYWQRKCHQASVRQCDSTAQSCFSAVCFSWQVTTWGKLPAVAGRHSFFRAVRSWSLRLSALMDSDLAWVNVKSGKADAMPTLPSALNKIGQPFTICLLGDPACWALAKT